MSSSSSPADPESCTISTCSLAYAKIEYVPSLAANATYLALFAAILVAHLGLGLRYRTWGFLAGMFCGVVLEVLGYVGRVQMHYNPFKFNPFLLYLLCLTVAPAFVSASIYLCLGRLINAIGAGASRFKPRTYAFVFVFCDVVSILLQIVGGAIAGAAGDNYQDMSAKKMRDKGVHIMLAGLAYQVFSLTLFMILWGEFSLRVYRMPVERKTKGFERLRLTFRFKAFQFALWLATICIFIRSVFRVAELNQGFGGPIANNEPSFLALEGPMIILATGALAVFHPGYCFAGNWDAVNWSLTGGEKGSKDAQEP